MKKTDVKLNAVKKVMNIVVDGRIEKEDAPIFLDQYQKATKSIDAKEYTLEVDCTHMQVLNQNMYDELAHVFKLYKETGFKHVNFTIKANSILKMQLNRIAKGVGLTNMSIVDIV